MGVSTTQFYALKQRGTAFRSPYESEKSQSVNLPKTVYA